MHAAQLDEGPGGVNHPPALGEEDVERREEVEVAGEAVFEHRVREPVHVHQPAQIAELFVWRGEVRELLQAFFSSAV